MSAALTRDELDRRGRAAAAALRARVDALVDLDPGLPAPAEAPIPPGSPGLRDGDDRDGDSEHVLVALDADGRDRARHRRRVRWLAVAAAAALIAALATMVAREPRTHVDSDQPRLLVPAAAPAGMDLVWVQPLDGSDRDPAVDIETAVYGEAAAADPWHGPVIVVLQQHVGDDRPSDFQPPMDAHRETIDIAGHEAILSEGTFTGAEAAGGDGGDAWQVTWTAGDERLVVGGSPGVGRDQVIAAATHVEDGRVAAAGLPDGFDLLARGPLDAAVDPMGLTSLPYTSGLVLTYRPPGGAEDGPFIAMLQRPGDPEAVDLLRFAYPDGRSVEVRGRHGMLGVRDDHVALQWLEPDGQLVTLYGLGFAEEVLLAMAEDLTEIAPGEVSDLAATTPGVLGPAPAGGVVVAEGRTPAGTDWRVTVGPAAPEGMAALTLEHADPSGESSTSESFGPPTALAASTVELDGGRTLVYGTTPSEAATVAVEAPGRSPVPLDAHPVEGWAGMAVVTGTVTPADLPAGTALVARAADGTELHRYPLT
jgi:hypothetical protein